MLSADQMCELCPWRHKEPGKSRLHRVPGFLGIGILLMMVGPSYAFCVRHAAEMSAEVSRPQTRSESATAKRPVTVADIIQMTRLGDPLYTDGAPSKGLVAKFSPDGKRLVVVLRKGNLENNTNEYSLILFETEDIFRSPSPRVLLTMASSSNRPAIQNLVWREDNDTILFLGEHPSETTQLYSFQCSTRELNKLTSHATNLSSFVASAKGNEIVFTAENPDVPFVNDDSARNGIHVTSERLVELMAGKHGGGENNDRALYLKNVGSEKETKIVIAGRVLPPEVMALSPDGSHLVLQTQAVQVPAAWIEYDDQLVKAYRHSPPVLGAYTSIYQYELVDLRSGQSRILLDAPFRAFDESEVIWSPDSQSVVMSNTYLPLNIDDAAERTLRKAHTFLAEVNVSDGQLVKISDQDVRLLDWDTKTNSVVCDVGRLDSLLGKATAKVYFSKNKTGDTWSRSDKPPAIVDNATPTRPEIVLDENMNQPPRIVATHPGTGQKSLLIDLNPQLQSLSLARVEEVAWNDSHHHEVKGGLYWPPDYQAGKKYPLVIQTHAWSPDRFWMDGPWTTAFAAQALANKGFFVLQVPDPDEHLVETPKEVPAAMSIYDSAIDFLNRRGLIDRDRIGITGFSRTLWYVTYALTHSKHHFAAADVADGVDYSYFQYFQSSNIDQSSAGDFDHTNGAAPFGKGLLRWLKVSPAFLMDKVETPLRIQTFLSGSLLGDWHWFTGLTRLSKPVEMVYLPEGIHVLEKPWDRMISQQGNVDWFCFWLKGEEDPDPAKAEQYKRWYTLRGLGAQATSNGASH